MQAPETTHPPLSAARYELQERIGEGASATVYRAFDTHTQSFVAVKVLRSGSGADEISRERFRREIRITRSLGHPQIVSIYDLVIADDHTWLVMEHLDGTNLKEFVRRHAPLALADALNIISQTLRVLAVCHARNVVHRDLKPENVMVISPAPELMIKLLDFGISRMTTLSDLTQTGSALGSPEYMAPELFAGNVYDPRTDLYALGIMAFELLTGRVPFRADSLAALCRQHVCEPVPQLSAVRTDVPEWTQQLIERLLAKHPFERYQSADEALADIDARTVAMRALPQLPRRECPRCQRETLAMLALCTRCGFALQRAVAPGRFDVRCAAGEDDTKLRDYFSSVFHVRPPERAPHHTLLLTGLDAESADLIKRSAHTRKLALIVNRRAQLERLKKSAFLTLLCGLTPTVVVLGFVPLTINRGSTMILALLQAGGMAALLAIVIRAYRRQIVWPLFRDPHAIVAVAHEESAWLRELIKPSSERPDSESALLMSQFIEKYFLLVHGQLAARIDPTINERLVSVLRTIARTVDVLAEVEPVLTGATRHELANEVTLLDERIAFESSPARQRLIENHRQRMTERLLRFATLDEHAAALTNRLIYLQYVFNSLLGRALVQRLPLDATALEPLEGAVAALNEDLVVSREVEAELARLR